MIQKPGKAHDLCINVECNKKVLAESDCTRSAPRADAGVVDEPRSRLLGLDAAQLRLDADAMDQDVVVRARGCLAADDFKTARRAYPPVRVQGHRADRDQAIAGDAGPARVNVEHEPAFGCRRRALPAKSTEHQSVIPDSRASAAAAPCALAGTTP